MADVFQRNVNTLTELYTLGDKSFTLYKKIAKLVRCEPTAKSKKKLLKAMKRRANIIVKMEEKLADSRHAVKAMRELVTASNKRLLSLKYMDRPKTRANASKKSTKRA